MKPAATDPTVRKAQDEGIIIRHAVTGRAGDPPGATPDTFGQATDPRANPLFKAGPIRLGIAHKPSDNWTATGRLSPASTGQLRPVCRYIGL